jgi:hypothetical protein
MSRPIRLLLLALLLALTTPVSAREDVPPPGALKASEVAASLEAQGFDPIVDMEFDDGRWEVKAFRDGRKRELRVDPMDARILSERDDD